MVARPHGRTVAVRDAGYGAPRPVLIADGSPNSRALPPQMKPEGSAQLTHPTAKVRRLTGSRLWLLRPRPAVILRVVSGSEDDPLGPRSGWYAVRCLFKKGWPGPNPGEESFNRYEERITLWQATSVDEAIVKAEAEALEYAAEIEENPDSYLGLAQAYILSDQPSDGSEVFSLLRRSTLEATDYLDTFFDTGDEHQTTDGGEV